MKMDRGQREKERPAVSGFSFYCFYFAALLSLPSLLLKQFYHIQAPAIIFLSLTMKMMDWFQQDQPLLQFFLADYGDGILS